MAEELTGTWRSVYGEYGGQMVAAARVSATEWTLEGNRFLIKVLGELEHEGTYSVDWKARPHKITIVYTKSSRFELRTPRHGIFQLTGATFKSCFGPVGGSAPTEFNTTQGLENILTVQQKKGAEGGLLALPKTKSIVVPTPTPTPTPTPKPTPTPTPKPPGGGVDGDDDDLPKHAGWW